jgi:hypothetical protein
LVAQSDQHVVTVVVVLLHQVGPQRYDAPVLFGVSLVSGRVGQIVATEKRPLPRRLEPRNEETILSGGTVAFSFAPKQDVVFLSGVFRVLLDRNVPSRKKKIVPFREPSSVEYLYLVGRTVEAQRGMYVGLVHKHNVPVPGSIRGSIYFEEWTDEFRRVFRNPLNLRIDVTDSFFEQWYSVHSVVFTARFFFFCLLILKTWQERIENIQNVDHIIVAVTAAAVAAIVTVTAATAATGAECTVGWVCT